MQSASFDRSSRRLVIASTEGLFVEVCEICVPAEDLVELAAERSTRKLSLAEREVLLQPHDLD